MLEHEPTPEQLGITIQNVAAVVRCPRIFSLIVEDLTAASCEPGLPKMRQYRNALKAGMDVVRLMTITCGLENDEDTLRLIETANLEAVAS